ncbi:uncharacterized protein N7511_007097 [Penicillium nucicola]|uniref:uncharacterized protein n=1 Tax=Penicillium nucicola TaxID=1850975 RepID=UPI0025455099|nr:uncharacterized protein N7511_007097 [Penicillium nucicola]KAJ5756915.1 hypothetical protein N7511_007097 [Penicillium nucicola]
MTDSSTHIANPISSDEADDNWSGLTDPAERRRRQNRINQRAYRKRKRLQNKDIHPKSLVKSTKPVSSTSLASPTSASASSASSVSSTSPQSQNAIIPSKLKACSPGTLQDLLEKFAKSAIESYARGDPTADHLMTLTKVNVFRAFTQNLELIGWSPYWMEDDAISIFNQGSPQRESTAFDHSHLPPMLQPTRVQKAMPHHPWLDFFPLPKMRDNLIEAGDEWDDEQLCHDIMGFWGESTMDSGLLVWGEPWDIRNWEVTEPFLKKWQWIVRGCPELMNATNAWRARRGEKLIFRYI